MLYEINLILFVIHFTSSDFDQLDLLTYEEVSYVSSFRRKTIVLIGKLKVTLRVLCSNCLTEY